MFDDMFDSAVESVVRRVSFAREDAGSSSSNGEEEEEAVTVEIRCVPGENRQIERFVPLCVWQGAEEACREMVRNKAHREELFKDRRRIIELGAGTGLCGLVAGKLLPRRQGDDDALLLLLTDGDDEAVGYLRESIALNHLSEVALSRRLRWGHAADVEEALRIATADAAAAACESTPYDLCLATDVIYEEQSIPALLQCASRLLRPETGILHLVNHRYRFRGLRDAVEAEAAKANLELISTCTIGADNLVDVYVYRRRGNKML